MLRRIDDPSDLASFVTRQAFVRAAITFQIIIFHLLAISLGSTRTVEHHLWSRATEMDVSGGRLRTASIPENMRM